MLAVATVRVNRRNAEDAKITYWISAFLSKTIALCVKSLSSKFTHSPYKFPVRCRESQSLRQFLDKTQSARRRR